MKMIIDWKRYDTDKASLVAEWDNGRGWNDFNYCSEDLYVTRNGSWFLHGRGGALSKYAEQAGQNDYEGGQTIVPLSEEEAAAWMAKKRPSLFDNYFSHLAADA